MSKGIMENEGLVVHQTENGRNPLTGLYYNLTFVNKVDKFLKTIENDTHMVVAVDMGHFRLFNKLYGREEGDALLVHIADCLMRMQRQHGGIVGYLGGDNFGAIMIQSMEVLEQLRINIEEGVKKVNHSVGFMPAFGVYRVTDIAESASVMYDRATLALSHVMGNYQERVCEYQMEMEGKLEEEITILSEVQKGLAKEEFTFYIQPQCDISSGKIVGGESLVRWKHSTKGMISPGVFIPVLEQNGFIADLDKYVWRKVCQWLRSWIDRGHKAIPISINVSRIDIFSMDVPGFLKELIEEYDLPPNLLKIEITESAYAENDDKLIRTVKQLRDASFLVMMDDFGSGYSSLNMLKSVAVDVLKMDMRFLEIDENEEEKGIGILESVVNMASQMKLPIIVEGVETKRQENFLLKMGCRYIQGYYYYKPMPIEDFENLIADTKKVDFDGIWCRQVEQIRVRELLDNNLFNDTMLNNILGAAAFYEMYENRIEITRVNEPYYKLAGMKLKQGEDLQKRKQFWNHVRDDDRSLFYSIFEQAYENPASGSDGYIHYVCENGDIRWVYMNVFFLRESGGHKLFYSSLKDMTKLMDKREESISEVVGEITDKQKQRMEKYYENLPFGYTVGKILLDKDGKPCDYEGIYANRELLKSSGGNLEKLYYLTSKIADNSWDELMKRAYQAAYKGETVDYHVHSRISGRYLHFTLYQYEYGYVSTIVRDMTHMHIYENALTTIMNSYREVYFVHLQDNYCRMVYPDENHMLERGNYEEIVNRHFAMGRILQYDEENIRKFLSLENLRAVLLQKDSIEYKYRRSINGNSEEWCLVSFQVSERVDGIPKAAVLTIRSIEALMREEEERRKSMVESFANMSEGFFIYSATNSERVLYANPSVLKIYGCESIEEFCELVGNSFRGMVHSEDLNRVESEIAEQIRCSENKLDFTRYRIIRKDRKVRWVDDCGHLEESDLGEGSKLFYVFITDITDAMSEQQKNSLIRLSQKYN